MMESLQKLAEAFVTGHPGMQVLKLGVPAFLPPLWTVGAADDAMWVDLRGQLGAGALMPGDVLPGAARVISLFFPYSPEICTQNAAPGETGFGWLYGRIEGHAIMDQTCGLLTTALRDYGFSAARPEEAAGFAVVDDVATWSHRHAGYICGMGTFGLSAGLITRAGVAGRLASLVTDAPLPVTLREYDRYDQWCTRCGACIARCPAGAISPGGKAHPPCADFVGETARKYAPRYGCGKCQVALPCTHRRPGKGD